VRAKVEHPFLVLKFIFGFRKVRFRGIAKNARMSDVKSDLP
jgi:IS5 family transposase